MPWGRERGQGVSPPVGCTDTAPRPRLLPNCCTHTCSIRALPRVPFFLAMVPSPVLTHVWVRVMGAPCPPISPRALGAAGWPSPSRRTKGGIWHCLMGMRPLQ